MMDANGHEVGSVVSVNVAAETGVRKKPVESIDLIRDRGVEGDAHAGDWHRQVSLLAQESVDKMIAAGLDVGPGDFGENLTTSGLDLVNMPIGTRLTVGGSAVLEISQIGKECHTRCAIYYQAGDCVMPHEGVFAVVIEPGSVRSDDTIEVVSLGTGSYERVSEGEGEA